MDVAVLLLADARFPGGADMHSGGIEEAVARHLVTGEADLAAFLLGRLHSAGELAAVFAAASAHAAARGVDHWAELDAELDARTPSPAQRAASRAQGTGFMRAGERAWPSPVLDRLVAATPHPHHPVVLGALTAIAGGLPRDAALACGYLAVSAPAAAAIRLLGLDPCDVNAVVARLSAEVRIVVDHATDVAGLAPRQLPAPRAPALDLLAEAHERHRREGARSFAS